MDSKKKKQKEKQQKKQQKVRNGRRTLTVSYVQAGGEGFLIYRIKNDDFDVKVENKNNDFGVNEGNKEA